MDRQQEICATILKTIRERSERAQLVSAREMLVELRGRRLLESEDIGPNGQRGDIFEQVSREGPDIKTISGKNGMPYYFSVLSLSETYAGILVGRSEDPLRLIAEIVRENSRLYPRPVAVDCFRERPFDLSREELEECLVAMSSRQEYEDIARTITSIGTPFLYSTQYLEPDYASTLAEWLDVGQADNP